MNTRTCVLLALVGCAATAQAQTVVLFDFDNAPIHTSLPVNVSAGGVTAFLSATGSGFSIQPANTMGFTPAGFGGLCIYPNSVFAADLLVSFSQVITGFSIMFAPQELGCDDTATMKVTAFMNAAEVGSNTGHAAQPGTWPTGTLSYSNSQGFNRVVVHYQARPPTCQDYGVIFLADNMTIDFGTPCYANCDSSAGTPLLTANDFQCFINQFAAGTSYANCDASTGTPALTANDFQCFINRFAAGCT